MGNTSSEREIGELAEGGWRRFRAFRALLRDQTGETSAALGRALTSHAAVEVRRAAATLMGSPGRGNAISPLTAALQDDDPEVRGRAAQSLGRLGATSALGDLAKAAEHALGEYQQVRPLFVDLPELTVALRAVEAISEIAAGGPPPARWWALDYLRAFSAKSGVPASLVTPSLRRLERATLSDLPRPAGPPEASFQNLPAPALQSED